MSEKKFVFNAAKQLKAETNVEPIEYISKNGKTFFFPLLTELTQDALDTFMAKANGNEHMSHKEAINTFLPSKNAKIVLDDKLTVQEAQALWAMILDYYTQQAQPGESKSLPVG